MLAFRRCPVRVRVVRGWSAVGRPESRTGRRGPPSRPAAEPGGPGSSARERIGELSARVNDFLRQAVPLIRRRFAGKVTYAAIPFEHVDWAPFDVIGVDLYRSAEVADAFSEGVRTLVAQGKPVAITEFGVAALRGAGDMGARCWRSVSTTMRPARWFGPTATPATTSTWPVPGSSRSSRTATAAPSPTWPGNPRSRSPPSPSTTARPDRCARADECCYPDRDSGRRRTHAAIPALVAFRSPTKGRSCRTLR